MARCSCVEREVHVFAPLAGGRIHDRHPARERHHELAVQAGDVEVRRRRDRARRRRRQRRLLAGEHRAPDRLGAAQHRRPDEVDVAAVREQRALGPAGRATREQDEKRIILGDRLVGHRRIGARGLELCELVLEHHDRQVLRHRRRVVREPIDTPTVAEQHRRCREVEGVGHLAARPPAVHRDGDPAQRRRRPERDRVLDAVGRRDGDPVALADAVLLGQRAGDCRDRAEHGCVRQGAVRKDHVRPVAEPFCGRDEHGAQIARPVHEHLHRHAEDRLGGELERCARSGQPVANLGRQRAIGPRESHGPAS